MSKLVIKNLHAEENIGTRYVSADQEHIHNKNRSNIRTQILSSINNVVMYVCYGFVILYLGWSIHTQRMEIAFALVLFNYFTIRGVQISH